ncbi:MAG TPA: MFS transporter, partial [Burkholderiaceae bacterium]
RYLSEMLLSPAGGQLAERFGAERMLVALSLVTAVLLAGFGAGGGTRAMWFCAAAVVALRALQLPLLAPIVAHRNPGPARVPALAARLVWRDIGAGLGPMLAGLLLPVVPPLVVYGAAATVLALAAWACGRSHR